MRRELADPAVRDIVRILDWSRASFGIVARRRYEALIARGLRAITMATPPTASRTAGEAAPGVRLFHLRHVRQDPGGTSIGHPRHLLAYRIVTPDLIVVLRVLHDAMDLPARLGEDDQRANTASTNP